MYHTLNSPSVSEDAIEDTINRIVSSLFSVAVTMGIPLRKSNLTIGTTPIIRCLQGNAAEMISQRLDSKLRDHFMNSRGDSGSVYSIPPQERPCTIPDERALIVVMIIMDRNMDLIPMLLHGWTVPP